MRICSLAFFLCVVVGIPNALAEIIPTDAPGFLEYFRARIQLYSSAPVLSKPKMQLQIETKREVEVFAVEDLFDACKANPAGCSEAVENAVQFAASQMTSPQVVSDQVFAGLLERAVPELPVDDGGGGSIFIRENANLGVLDFRKRSEVKRRVSGMLWEACYANSTRQRDLLTELDLSTLASSQDDLFALCEKNLAAKLGPMNDAYSVLGTDNIGVVQGSRYESARVLLVDQWQKLAAKWGGHILVSMPLWNTIVFTPDTTDAGVQALLARSKEISATSRDMLTYDVYELDGSEWTERTHEARGMIRVYRPQ